jgi:hypothetical protein
VQVALCEVALGQHSLAQEVTNTHTDVRSRCERLGVVLGDITTETKAEQACAQAIANAKALSRALEG